MSPREDYTGQKYSRLTFVEYSHQGRWGTYWKLRCDCGKEIVARAGHVIDGQYLSCGCARWKDYTGEKYGKLTFVERVSGIGKGTRWKLLCDCGREIIAKSDNVIGGGTRSCGCSRMRGFSTCANNIMCNYISHARQRGFKFNLSKDRFVELIHQPCFYCGEENSNTWLNKRTGEQYSYNGIDRFDSSKDYEEGNVVPCCSYCNWAKSARNGYDYIEWARKIVAYQDHKQEVDNVVISLFQNEAVR